MELELRILTGGQWTLLSNHIYTFDLLEIM